MARETDEPRSTKSREDSKQLLMRWLDLSALSKENVDLRNMLHDEVTNLPSIALLMDNIQMMLEKHGQIGVVLIDVDTDNRFETINGHQSFEGMMKQVGMTLSRLPGEIFQAEGITAAVVKDGNDFVILIAPSQERARLDLKYLLKTRRRVLKVLRESMRRDLDPAIAKNFLCRAGVAIIENDPSKKTGHLVSNSLETAKESSTK